MAEGPKPDSWAKRLAPFKAPDDARAAREVAVTVILLAVFWAASMAAHGVSLIAMIACQIMAAGFLVRCFMLQHDCGHGALFSSKAANDWTGRMLSIGTLTPYDHWRRLHATHHATSGDLDRRGVGDIETLTVAEYAALTPAGRWRYRLYRHPFVLFVVGPAYMFLLQQRIPVREIDRMAPWASAIGTNLGVAAVYGALIWAYGFWAFVAVHLPIVLAAAATGVWLFYVQHQFDGAYWSRRPDWSREEAALHGSSFYDLPKPIMWMTGNIGVHHVHHLASGVPFFRLPEVLEAFPEFREIGRITFWRSLKFTRLHLWDEAGGELVSFREAHAAQGL